MHAVRSTWPGPWVAHVFTAEKTLAFKMSAAALPTSMAAEAELVVTDATCTDAVDFRPAKAVATTEVAGGISGFNVRRSRLPPLFSCARRVCVRLRSRHSQHLASRSTRDCVRSSNPVWRTPTGPESRALAWREALAMFAGRTCAKQQRPTAFPATPLGRALCTSQASISFGSAGRTFPILLSRLRRHRRLRRGHLRHHLDHSQCLTLAPRSMLTTCRSPSAARGAPSARRPTTAPFASAGRARFARPPPPSTTYTPALGSTWSLAPRASVCRTVSRRRALRCRSARTRATRHRPEAAAPFRTAGC